MGFWVAIVFTTTFYIGGYTPIFSLTVSISISILYVVVALFVRGARTVDF